MTPLVFAISTAQCSQVRAMNMQVPVTLLTAFLLFNPPKARCKRQPLLQRNVSACRLSIELNFSDTDRTAIASGVTQLQAEIAPYCGDTQFKAVRTILDGSQFSCQRRC